ncbi:MAG: hypothetical protein QW179_02810 [Candidatus Hadarchaeales archaeon]
MKILSLAEVMEEMRKLYQKHPNLRSKWRAVIGRDDYGFDEFYFFAPGIGLWEIKGERKSPYEIVGKGARIPARRIDDEIIAKMMGGIPVPFGLMAPHPKHKDRAILAAGVSSYREETEPLKEHFPKSMRKADEKLRSEVEKLRRLLELDKPYL